MIKRLSNEVTSNIKSYSELSNVNESIIELVYNSLDANSKNIVVKCDFKKFSFEIIDDGVGMSHSDLKIIGERNVTSKISTLKCLDTLKTYGFHGEALCNIINLSDQVEIIISTKDDIKNEYEFFKKEFTSKSHSSVEYNVKINNLDAKEISKEKFSTLIRVKNIFGKFPLRQKQLVESKYVKSLRKQFEILSLINFNVEFFLESLNDKRIIFHSRSHTSLREKFASLIGLKPDDQSIKSFLHRDNLFSSFLVDGHIYLYSKIGINNNFNFNLNTSVSSRYQFIFVNNKHIQNSDFYDLIATKLSSCKELNILNSDLKQTVFCLVINAPPKCFKIVSIKNKTIVEFNDQLNNKVIRDLLSNYVDNFLIEFGFKHLDSTAIDEIMNPLNLENHFLLVEDLKDSRSSKTFRRNFKKEQTGNIQLNNHFIRKDDLKHVLKNSFKKFKNKHTSSLTKSDKIIALQSTFETMIAKNKSNLIGENVNNNVLFLKNNFNLIGKEMNVLSKTGKWLNLQYKNKSTQTVTFERHHKIVIPLKKTLKENWIVETNNDGLKFFINLIDGTTTYDANLATIDVFCQNSNSLIDNFLFSFLIKSDSTETKLNFTDSEESNKLKSDSVNEIKKSIEKMSLVKWRNQNEFFENRSVKTDLNFEYLSGSIKINRKDLKDLNVVGQFDCKFIISYLKIKENESCSGKGFSLFIFDQHACDERIRLENLLKENLDESGNLLVTPFNKEIKISSIPEKVLHYFISKMKKVGFYIETCDSSNQAIANQLENKTLTIRITKIPTILFKRLKLKNENDILLILNNLIETHLKSSLTKISSSNEHLPNLTQLSNFPTELVEVFKMDACRGSIKFGDKLTTNECKEIIKKLSKCKLPFQCAHGRPTIIPLQNIFIKKVTLIFIGLITILNIFENIFVYLIKGTSKQVEL